MKVKPLATYRVIPVLPEPLVKLKELAYNFIWTWSPDLAELFHRLDSGLWERAQHNPARMIREVSQERLNEVSEDRSFLDHYERCVSYLEHYLREPTWFDKAKCYSGGQELVYFSMEYGINECLPVYSGGLGVLSGDHVKSASDLGLPMVAVGLAYQEGYFQQQLTADGYQKEVYKKNDFTELPVTPVLEENGERLTISVPFPGRTVYIGAWKAQIGRVPLYLLDTDLPQNNATDRRITYTLYGGDKETRIQQEIVLGIGGVQMVTRLGVETVVCHMNEGHSAFIQLARIARAMREQNLSAYEAYQLVAAGTVFTTHTPVPAGIDQFSQELMNRYFATLWDRIGVSKEYLLALGARDFGAPGQPFNMAIFALRSSDYANGVSRLHGIVARDLWEGSWPTVPKEETPIGHVTNGIHLRTWTSDRMGALYDRHLGNEWRRNPNDVNIWKKVRDIPDEELWLAHVQGREKLIEFTRWKLAQIRARTTGVVMSREELEKILHPRILTIGFARRFATYKRATLILRHPERLKALLTNDNHPLQIIFAGKAHPQDEAGKALIHDIIHFAKTEGVDHRLVFLENYDMEVARYLVQGVDVWLNTPRRPLEASGTSGMKVLANGGLNLSILDGWWDEAYDSDLGWAIGSREFSSDTAAQDEYDAKCLYDLLEGQIAPLFYRHEDEKIPRRWIVRMKNSIANLVPRFNAQRMVMEYCLNYYTPAHERYVKLYADNLTGVREFAAWKSRVREHWHEISIGKITAAKSQTLNAGSEIEIKAEVNIGSLSLSDVRVEAFVGTLLPDETLESHHCVPLSPEKSGGLFSGKVDFRQSGRYGFTVRVIPSHDLLGNPLKTGLVCWGENITYI